jgi:hypothetical protein
MSNIVHVAQDGKTCIALLSKDGFVYFNSRVNALTVGHELFVGNSYADQFKGIVTKVLGNMVQIKIDPKHYPLPFKSVTFGKF